MEHAYGTGRAKLGNEGRHPLRLHAKLPDEILVALHVLVALLGLRQPDATPARQLWESVEYKTYGLYIYIYIIYFAHGQYR